MIYLLVGIICLAIGYFYRDLKESIKELKKTVKEPAPDIGVTSASYGQTFQKANQEGEIGLVEPKTPAQLEWMEQEELRQMQHKVKVNSK